MTGEAVKVGDSEGLGVRRAARLSMSSKAARLSSRRTLCELSQPGTIPRASARSGGRAAADETDARAISSAMMGASVGSGLGGIGVGEGLTSVGAGRVCVGTAVRGRRSVRCVLRKITTPATTRSMVNTPHFRTRISGERSSIIISPSHFMSFHITRLCGESKTNSRKIRFAIGLYE